MPKRARQVFFSVQGRGPFPMDMLRYDACYPADEQSSFVAMDFNCNEPRTVHLTSLTMNPTPGRWESFGWAVLPRSNQEKLKERIANAD